MLFSTLHTIKTHGRDGMAMTLHHSWYFVVEKFLGIVPSDANSNPTRVSVYRFLAFSRSIFQNLTAIMLPVDKANHFFSRGDLFPYWVLQTDLEIKRSFEFTSMPLMRRLRCRT